MSAALSAKGLMRNFGSLAVANDISFDLPKGARHALIGPNGAGKTTLINLMTGMLKPDAGRIALDGRDITDLPPAARVRLGLVRTFQINSLFPDLTPLEAVTVAVSERRRESGVWWQALSSRKDTLTEAWDILVSLRLDAHATRRTRELAYGQQRLLEIALALATRPQVLLLDEPAAGVPKDESGELFAVLNNLSSDLAILFIEHDMELVFRFASQIIVMVAGRILLQGPPAEIARNPQVREVYLGRAHHG